jgi:hypothetical protein
VAAVPDLPHVPTSRCDPDRVALVIGRAALVIQRGALVIRHPACPVAASARA